MTLRDLVVKNRSYRRFHQDIPVSMSTLRALVDLAKFSASGANKQPLRFYLSCDPEKNAKIFSLLTWAIVLKDWPGPEDGERPSAYIIILGDTEVTRSFGVDHGIAAQTILLGATERGLGGCMLSSLRQKEARKILNIPARYEILLTIAVGKPKEKVVIEQVGLEGDTRYWRDADNVHHLPKRKLDDVIVTF